MQGCGCALCAARARAAGAASSSAGRSAWYDNYFATAMQYGMDDYEAAIAPHKQRLFGELLARLRDDAAAGRLVGAAAAAAAGAAADGGGGGSGGAAARVLELGIGTGPNFPFYASAAAAAASPAPASPTTPSSSSSSSSSARGAAEVPPTGNEPRQSPAAAAAVAAAAAAATPPSPMSPPLPLDIVGLDPNPRMLDFAADAADAAGLPPGWRVTVREGAAEALPFGEGAFDAAVVTLVLCSVRSQAAALAELRRVVRPMGHLLVIEHVAADRRTAPVLRAVQGALSPLQSALADGCRLDRDTGAALAAAGGGVGSSAVEGEGGGGLERFELQGFSLLAPHVAGVLAR